MRKLWLCLFYALCVFTIVFSLFWMALPRLPPGPCRLRRGDPCPLPAQHLGAGRTGNRLHHLLPL